MYVDLFCISHLILQLQIQNFVSNHMKITQVVEKLVNLAFYFINILVYTGGVEVGVGVLVGVSVFVGVGDD